MKLFRAVVQTALASLLITPVLHAAEMPAISSQPTTLPTDELSLFDPARHMRVSEVRPGMKGYGLSVFRGTNIDRFNVEVVSILKNFNPKYDVVLIRCLDKELEHTGSIAGMSGSPIYLHDDQGRDRMIGAFAYGWPLMKDPVAGVQPIEYMLRLANEKPMSADESPRAERSAWPIGDAVASFASLDESFVPDNWRALPRSTRANETIGATRSMLAASRNNSTNESAKLSPLATPLMVGGFGGKALEAMTPLFRAAGLTPLQAGGTSTHSSEPHRDVKLAPGSVLVAPLLTGDMELSAVGTCTEVLGDRFFGFGHPFNNEGAIALPAGSGEINGVIAKLDQSFKLGSLTNLRGTLTADRVYGVGGVLGASPPTIPVDFHVTYQDGSAPVDFHAEAALHSKLTPLVIGAAFGAALTGTHDLPPYFTIDYSIKLDFANGKTVNVKNRAVNVPPQLLLMELALPIGLAADNPFGRVPVKNVSGSFAITPVARDAELLYVNVPKLKFRPGETMHAYAAYRPFHASESTLPIDIELPHDLPNGQYALTISDASRYLQDEAATEPFRFTAESASDIFSVLNDFTGVRRDALYARITRQPDGVAVGRIAMPRLPSSRREVLLGSGRSNTTPFVSSTVKIIPTDYVMEGSADFQIEIDSEARVEVGSGARATKQESGGAGNSTNTNAKSDEDKSAKPNKPTAGDAATDKPDSGAEPAKPG